MERAVQKPHQSTADLLTWSETPPPATNTPRSAARSHQVRFILHFFFLLLFDLFF